MFVVYYLITNQLQQMIEYNIEKKSPTGKRVDLKVKANRLFKDSFEFLCHIVAGDEIIENSIQDMVEKMVQAIDNESYTRGKNGTYIFRLTAWNATGFIYQKNFPA